MNSSIFLLDPASLPASLRTWKRPGRGPGQIPAGHTPPLPTHPATAPLPSPTSPGPPPSLGGCNYVIPAQIPESNTQHSAIRIQSDPVGHTRLGLSGPALQTEKKSKPLVL